MNLFGVGLYSKFLLKQPWLTNKEISEKTIPELENLISLSKCNIWWHVKNLLVNLVIASQGIYYIKNYNVQLGIGIFFGILSVNNFYGILANMHNNIRFGIHISVINYGKKISRAIKEITTEINSLNSQTIPQQNQGNIESIILKEIIDKKCTWMSLTYLINDHSVYVIQNSYYEDLIFVFPIKATAEDFQKELSNYDSGFVDYLHNNPEEISRIRNDFIKSKLQSKLVYHYYSSQYDTKSL